jgi:tetratricopeptide (TPR) repeat protein
VFLILGLSGPFGSSATQLRAQSKKQFGEEHLSNPSVLAREREAFQTLENLIYATVSGTSAPPPSAALDSYLQRVRRDLFDEQEQIFISPPTDDAFTNRVSELASLDAATRAPGSLVYLVGMGGSGKSELASQFASRYRQRFKDAIIHVDLAHSEREAALFQVAFAFGAGEALMTLRNDAERISYIQALLARRRVLVVLDDAEQSHSLEYCLTALRPASIVVTTRIRSLSGVHHVVDVQPLQESESTALLARTVGVDRVAAEGESTRRIVELLEGLPLALRVYGARIAKDNDSLASHVARLTTFALTPQLELAARGKQTKHSSLSVSFALSFEALTSQEISMMKSVGAMAGNEFTSLCAAALLGSDFGQPARLVEALFDSSLLLRTGDGRWRLHTLINDYVNVNYPPDVETWTRLIGYAGELADNARRAARSPAEQAAFSRLEADLPALDVALEHVRQMQNMEVEGRLLAGYGRLAAMQGTGVRVYDRMKELLSADLASPTRMALLESATWLAGELSEFLEGVVHGDEWLTVATEVGDLKHQADALGRLASHCWCAGDYERAGGYLSRAEASWATLGDSGGLTTALNLRGLIKCYEGDYEAAAIAYRDAFARWTDQGDELRAAIAGHNLGEAERCLGHVETARTSYQASLDVRTRLRSLWDIVNSLNCLGEVSRASQEADAADRYYAAALELAFPMWNKVAIATAIAGRASLHVERDPAQAAILMGAAEGLLKQARSRLGPANALDYPRYREKCLNALGHARFMSYLGEGLSLAPVSAYDMAKAMPQLE